MSKKTPPKKTKRPTFKEVIEKIFRIYSPGLKRLGDCKCNKNTCHECMGF